MDFEHVRFWTKFFGKNGRSIILPVQNFCLRTMFFFGKNYKFVIRFALWAKDFHTSDTNVPAFFSNSRSTWPEKFFGKKISWKKAAFNFYFDFRQNVSRLSAVFFGLAFHKFRFSFLEQNVGVTNCSTNQEVMIFPKSERNDFELQTKLMIRLSQNFILRTQMETLEQFVCQEM